MDGGDVMAHFLVVYSGDARRAAETASAYGWSETSRVRFSRSVIVQPETGPQFVQCPECKAVLYRKKNGKGAAAREGLARAGLS